MKLSSFNDLLVHELRDLYSAEHQVLAALPRLAKKATDPELRTGYELHAEETRIQIKRLDEIADLLNLDLMGEKCKGIEALIREGIELLKEDPDEFIDQALIAASQRVEHYKIAAYGCAITFAEMCKCKPAARLLKASFAEKVRADKKLTTIARKEQ